MNISDYGYILVYFLVAVAFGAGTFWMSRLAGSQRPYYEKNTTYECGEVPVGEAWVRFNVSYYIFALIFAIFDVETVFMYPWAAVFREMVAAGNGFFAFFEMFVFIMILVLGLVYAWRKGVLKWV